jgi:hypothetical protein
MQQYSYDGAVMGRRNIQAVGLPAIAAILALASACSTGDSAPPVATATFVANKTRVPLGSPIELTYRFDVAPGAKIDGDYKVFVHVLRDDGVTMWNDDHDPSIPTSQWKPGQTIQYTRTRFVPVFPFLGEASVEIGLYRDQERLPLQSSDPAKSDATNRAYRVGTLQLLPSSENVFLMFRNGWHPAEFDANEPTLTWQWTQKQAVFTFKNPKKDATFYMEFDARSDVFPDKKQVVTVWAGDQQVASIEATSSMRTLQKVPVTAAQLGNNDIAEMRIDVDKTFVPAKLQGGGRDPRELGIRVYHTFLEVR